MTPQYILLVQSVTGAVFTIIALLLVAAVIGYLTAWFYAKSVYTPIIKGLEAEKAELQKQVADLKENVSRLNKSVADLNGKVAGLEETVAARDKEIAELKKKIRE
jgi:peptidoglycan hydrolase CwlO-like protein